MIQRINQKVKIKFNSFGAKFQTTFVVYFIFYLFVYFILFLLFNKLSTGKKFICKTECQTVKILTKRLILSYLI